jgi:hypothetical protein
MDGLARAVGNGLTSVMATAFDAIGATIRSIVDVAAGLVPAGWGPVVLFVGLAGAAWFLAKR